MSKVSSSSSGAGRGASSLVALLSVLALFGWTAVRVHYAFSGNWTAVFCTGRDFPVPPELAAETYVIEGTGYDGQFYRYLAHDPLLQRGFFHYVDLPQMRSRRVLVPSAAWLLAFGKQGRIDAAYIFLEMLFPGLGVYWCGRLLVRRGRSPLWGVLFLLVPATLASFDRMLVDGPLAALFAGFLLYCEDERWARVWVLAVLAALTRDTGLLFGAALVIDRLLRRDWRRAVWFATSALPAVAWYGYVAARVPLDPHVPVLALPGWGLVRRLLWFRPHPNPRLQMLLRVTDILAVLGVAISVVVAARWLRGRAPGPVTICVALFAVLALILGSPVHMIDAFGYARPISPLLLWVMIEAVSRKAWNALVPPLLVNSSVALVFVDPLVAIGRGLLGH